MNRIISATLACHLAMLVMTEAHAVDAPSKKPAAAATSKPSAVRELDWDALLPASERGAGAESPEPAAPAHDYLGEGAPGAAQTGSFQVNQELDGKVIKLPGFIVPIVVSKQGVVSEFFLVPYFGACIHVPPPPPNQIVFVKTAKGLALESLYEAYWITGTIQTSRKNTPLAQAAYVMEAQAMEIYHY